MQHFTWISVGFSSCPADDLRSPVHLGVTVFTLNTKRMSYLAYDPLVTANLV